MTTTTTTTTATTYNNTNTTTNQVVTMKAAIYTKFGGPIQIQKNVPIPQVPKDGVLIQVKATGVCRSDWHGWKGHDGDIHKHGLPFCPGHEFSGIVVQVGIDTTNFKPGDRVAIPFILSCGTCRYCCNDNGNGNSNNQPTICAAQEQPGFTQWGSFAEYVAIPRADRNLRHLPSNVTFVQAAALGCRFTTAYRAVLQQGNLIELIQHRRQQRQQSNSTLSTTRRQHPTTVAVFGCGGLGLSCIMIAASQRQYCDYPDDITIIAIDVSSKALQKALDLGATHIVQVAIPPKPVDNTTTTTSTSSTTTTKMAQDIAKQVAEFTDPNYKDGADLTLDAAGFAMTSEAAVYATKPGRRMVQVGLPHDRIPNIPMNIVAGRELHLIGSHGFDAKDLPDLLQLISENNNNNNNNNSNQNQNANTATPTTFSMDPCQLVEREVSLEEGCRELENMDKSSPLGIVMITKFGNDDNDITETSSSSSNLLCRL